MKIYVDLETRSKVDLKAAGARRYAADPSTQITTASWRIAGANRNKLACNIRGLEHLGRNPMAEFVRDLNQATHIVAHHINFDANVIFATLGPCGLALEKLDCTMARAQRLSLPGGLDELCTALGLPGKDPNGHRLVMATCKPKKDGTWNEDPEIFRQLLAYNDQDVNALVGVDQVLAPLPPEELEIWRRTWRKNARGLPLDIELCQRIASRRAEIELEIANDLRELTGGAVTAVTQRARIVEWVKSRGLELPNTQRATLEAWLESMDLPYDVWRVLTIMFESGGSAPTKAQALLDRHVQGYFQDATRYFGARSGRGTSEGCFGPDTLVLTQHGWKRIIDVCSFDKTWDGTQWNAHSGTIYQGVKKTVRMYGLTVTEDHMILCGSRWNSTEELKSKPLLRFRALATGLAASLRLATLSACDMRALFFNATADLTNASLEFRTSERTTVIAACPAYEKSIPRTFLRSMVTKTLQSAKSLVGCCGSFLASITGARTQMTKIGLTTEGAAFVLLPSGSLELSEAINKREKFSTHSVGVPFLRTFSRLKTAALLAFNSTALTTTKATNRATFVSSRAKKTQIIDGQQQLLKKTGICSPVYDILNCGPKNRYMILSSAGPLIVHNCNMFNIARPSGKYDAAETIVALKANPTAPFNNTQLSDVLRGSIVAPPGYAVIDADLSNVELRLSLWFAGDTQKLAMLANGSDLYVHTAGQMLGVPSLTKKTHPKERQAAKKIVLSGGYGVGVPKLYNSFKTDKDLPYEYRRDLTYAQVSAIHSGYRDANVPLQMAWKNLDQSARATLAYPNVNIPACGGKINFRYDTKRDTLDVTLPSGRSIPHYRPHISPEGEMMFYRAKFGRMLPQKAWGGGWMEIVCQSAARDVITTTEAAIEREMPDVLLLLDIYDSVVALAPVAVAKQRMEQLLDIMRRPLPWSAGLPLDGEGYVGPRMAK